MPAFRSSLAVSGGGGRRHHRKPCRRRLPGGRFVIVGLAPTAPTRTTSARTANCRQVTSSSPTLRGPVEPATTPTAPAPTASGGRAPDRRAHGPATGTSPRWRQRPGVTAEQIDAAARDVLADAGRWSNFVHRTGHGIGLSVHEELYIVAGNGLPLTEAWRSRRARHLVCRGAGVCGSRTSSS